MVPIIVFFAVVLLFFTKPVDITTTTLNNTADSLTPNVRLQLLPGEKYGYTYKMSGVEANITYTMIGLVGDCVGVRADASAAQEFASSTVCINMETGEVRANELSADFFQPWMLSLRDGFSWNSTSRITYPPPLEFNDATLRTVSVLGREDFRGRPAFKVRSISTRIINGQTANVLEADLWVDEEKRVLLGSESKLFTIELISAPFPLSNSSSN